MSREILFHIADRIDRAADRLRFSGRESDAEVCALAASRIRQGTSVQEAKAIEKDLMTGMLTAVQTRLFALSGSGEYDTPAAPDAPDQDTTEQSGSDSGSSDFQVNVSDTTTPTEPQPSPGPTPEPEPSTTPDSPQDATPATDATPTPQPGPTPDSSTDSASSDDDTKDDQDEGQHFQLKDDSVSLTPEAQSSVSDLASEYFEATGKDLTITSGSRDTADQAQVMFDKLEKGSDLSEYKDSDAAGEIKDAYDKAKEEGKSDSEIVDAMQGVIDTQVDNGVLISNHLRDGAVDVRSKDMTDEEKQAFIDAVTKATGKPPLVEGVPPHFHVDLGDE